MTYTVDHRVYSYVLKCLYIDQVHLQVSGYVFYIYVRVCISCRYMYCTNQLVGTTDGHKLFNVEHTIIILSMAGHSPDFLGLTNSIGMQLIKIEYRW